MNLLSFFMAGEQKSANRKALFFFLAASLSILIPTPARLAFGVTMLVVFNLQALLGVLFLRLIRLLRLTPLKNALMLVEIVSVTILLKQLLVLVCPVAALTLGFIIYLPAFSSSLMDILFDEGDMTLLSDLRSKLPLGAVFTAVALAFFLLRELLGYGTLTFIASRQLVTVALPFRHGAVSACAFLATIPGAFLLLAVLLALYLAAGARILRLHRSAL